jgi:GntR family transcriptional regulator/MocR family aminotransferase
VTQLAQISGTRITGRAAGLHLVMWLPPGTDAAQVVETAAARDLRVADLQGYRAVADPDAPPALVIGYGNIPDTAVPDAVRILATCVAAAAPHGRAVP